MNPANHDEHHDDEHHHQHGASGNRYSGDAQLENDIIHRWQNKQSMRSIARELGLNRFKVASLIGAHQKSIASPTENQLPPSLGSAPVPRGSKLERFEPQLIQLLERYPRITAQRVFEELQRLGYDGGYSILRVRVKQLRATPAKPITVRFETTPGAQAQMDWSTYEIHFTQEGTRRVQLFSYILGYSRRPFHYVQTNLLNAREFRSLDHLNEVARWWLSQVNDTRLHGTTKKTPLELHAQELPQLLPLPTIRFDTAQVVYRVVDTDGTLVYANNRYSAPWQLIGEQLPIRITENELLIYNRSLSLVAKHVLLQGHTGQTRSDAAHAPPKDVHEQLATIRQRYAELGPIASQFLEGLLAKQRCGKRDAQQILGLLQVYSHRDILAAMSRAIQFHAYGYQSLERILAHVGTPKSSWQRLSEAEQAALKRLTESEPIGPRRSEDYQKLLDDFPPERPRSAPPHEKEADHPPTGEQPPECRPPECRPPAPQFPDEPSGQHPASSADAQDSDDSGQSG